MRNDGPDARSWQTDGVALPTDEAGLLRNGESFLKNHEAAVGRNKPQLRLQRSSKGSR
jgi:hypothetical protein